jgi:CRP/FNR family transcriptional regulator, cyclic AMP receptor protein
MIDAPKDGPLPLVKPALLRDIGLFGGLDEESLRVIAERLPAMKVEPGSTVIEEGDSSQEMFVVLGGELEVVKKSRDGHEVMVALIGPGDWFGEMSILDVQPRSATVRAVAPTLLLRITAEHVEQLFYRRDVKSYAILIMNIARELSRRLRVADGLVAQFVTSVTDAYSGTGRKSRPASI